MIGAGFFSRRFLALPSGMSDAERQTIIDQARREAFTQDGASARALFIDAIITLFGIMFVAVSVMLGFTVFVREGTHVLVGPILIGSIIVVAATLASLVREHQRAKLLNPIIRELLKSRDSETPKP
jgi:uncharacterized membrane protein YcjF (UPF0283 family)